MAGDILLYQADIVPIGDDQRQHLELARDIAERFNTRFGELFVVPDGVYPEVGARIMDLQDPLGKMGKTGSSEQGTIRILDDPDVVRRKFKTAVTDSGREVRRSPDKPGVTNLIDILSVASGDAPEAIEARFDGQGYGAFKDGGRRGRRRAADTDPTALRGASCRRARAAPPLGAGRREGEGDGRADTCGDVRADGLRHRVEARRRDVELRPGELAPFARREVLERQPGVA